jgi:heptosyltransferase II
MEFPRILVRATNWLGDAVMSLPALGAIRDRYPQAHLAVLARPWVADLYQGEGLADEIIPYEARGLRGRWRLASRLRKQRFDAAVLFPNSFDSALVVWMAGIPNRIGYDCDGRGFLLTRALPRPLKGEIPAHEVFYYLELVRRAGMLEDLPQQPVVELRGAPEAGCRGAKLFEQLGVAGLVIGISPGAQNSRAKQWLPERFVETACRLAGVLEASVAVFGSAREIELCCGVAAQIRRAGVPVISLAGETTLAQFIALAAACRVFVTNDSGAMHVASALGVPTVAIFGPTEYLATSPAGSRSVMVREPVDCSPCMLRDCPIDHRCMTRIGSERVAEAALKLLK